MKMLIMSDYYAVFCVT